MGKLVYSPGINTARIAATRFSATFACYDPDLSGLRRLMYSDVKQFASNTPPPSPRHFPGVLLLLQCLNPIIIFPYISTINECSIVCEIEGRLSKRLRS